MKKYIISPVTTFDEDEMLYGTKIGSDEPGMPLHYTVWGETEEESREKAEYLKDDLEELS